MDEKFTDEEKTAVASVLYNLVEADYRMRQEESDCLNTCLSELEFDATGFEPIARNELPKQAYETLKRMTKEKKRTFSRMMTQVSRSDGHFGPLEQALVKEILEMCEVPFVHK